MSKTNVYVLIATALLGVLLYVVQGFVPKVPVSDVPTPVREMAPEPASPDAATRPPTILKPDGSPVPRVSAYQELVDLLDERGIDGRAAAAEAALWYQQRGFIGPNEWLGVTAAMAPATYFESLDPETLAELARGGDIGAMQTQAAARVFEDPFDALRLYTDAARAGSIQAMLKIGSLLETFADVALEQYANDAEYAAKLLRLQSRYGQVSMDEAAFHHAFAAVRDGGRPVATPDTVARLGALAAGLTAAELQRACTVSEDLFIATAETRRSRGATPLTTQPPPVFMGDPDLEARLPCGDTAAAFYPLLDLSACDMELVIDARGLERHLYICAR